MMEKLTKNFKQIFKYRNSLIFENQYNNENDFLKSLRSKGNTCIIQKDKNHLNKIIELTKLDLQNFKEAIHDVNFYNMSHYLYNVNDFLIDLLNKDEILENHIKKVIDNLVKDKTFTCLDEKKIERILSFFSEIICIGNLVSGKPKFVISVNKDKNYKKNGRFDLMITKESLSYYFDVKRVNSSPIEKWDQDEVMKVNNKIKDEIQKIIDKGAREKVNRPLFLLLDVSDWALLETKEEGVFKAGCVCNEILRILGDFFNKNQECMQDLKDIVGVGLFYSFIGVTKNQELSYLFWHQGYTNKNHKFLNEKKQILELNNVIFDKLKEEHDKIISRYTDSSLKLL